MINYNYVSPYINLYNQNDVFSIHGKIFSHTEYIAVRNNGMEVKNEYPIMLGLYNYDVGITNVDVLEKYIENDYDKEMISVFREYLGDLNLRFAKSISLSEFGNYPYKEEWLIKLKENHYDEIVVSGHSLSEQDIKPLLDFLAGNLDDVKRIRFIGHSGKDDPQAWEETIRLHIRKIFSFIGEISIRDNNLFHD